MNKIMKKNHFSLWRKARLLSVAAVGALLLSSCAQDGFDDDERWSSSVSGITLVSPTADNISISASADGSQTVIVWDVVKGAGGYECTVMDVTDAENPAVVDGIQDSLIDRCQIAVSREADHNYTFSIKAMGNKELNNTEAESATLVAFNSFTAALATIPEGSDITAFIAENPMPDEAKDKEMAYDLVAGGQYTMSGSVDFGNKRVQLRTTDQNNPATIKMTGNASISTATGMSIKNVNFDCSASTDPFIAYSETPDESTMGVISGSQNYYDIQQSLLIENCKITGVNNYFIYDNKVKYCVGTAIIRNCVVQLTGTECSGIIRFETGFINDLTVDKSTFYGVDGADSKYFVQYSNSARCDRGGYSSNSITYSNSTFYNVAYSGQWGNYSGFAGRNTSFWNMTNCIFVNCGSNQITRRFLAGRSGTANRNFANNTYMYDGAFESTDGVVSGYDESATAIESDPMFADPANGDFTVGGSEQKSKRTGDPRWLPAN